jgi:cell division protein FtsW (lipid II flippase)
MERAGRIQHELSLTLIAVAILVAGFITIDANEAQDPFISLDAGRAALALGSVMILISLVWSVTRLMANQVLFPCICVLMAIGMVSMRRLERDIGGPDSTLGAFAGRHNLYAIAALAILVASARWFPFWGLLRRYKYLTVAASLLLLVATMVAGRERYGAKLWLGAGPVEFQTSELIKIGLILFLAAYLHEKHELMHGRWHVWRLSLPPVPYLLPVALLLVVALLMVVAMNDLGTALLLFSTALAMLYVALRQIWYVVLALAIFAAGSAFAYVTFDRVGVRIQNWLDPWADPFVSGYQQIQADYAMSSGGFLGSGLMRGEPWRIPAVHTDYIFAAIVEEWGAVAGMAIVVIFAVMLFQGLAISAQAETLYDRYLAVGLISSIIIQAIVILGGVLRLLPLTGVTLPFVSAGGTSLLLNALCMGMLLNISHRRNESASSHG